MAFSTHSQAEDPSLRGSDVSADLGRLPEDRPLRDVAVSDVILIEEWLEAVNEGWQGDGHHEPESHDGKQSWRERRLKCTFSRPSQRSQPVYSFPLLHLFAQIKRVVTDGEQGVLRQGKPPEGEIESDSQD